VQNLTKLKIKINKFKVNKFKKSEVETSPTGRYSSQLQRS